MMTRSNLNAMHRPSPLSLLRLARATTVLALTGFSAASAASFGTNSNKNAAAAAAVTHKILSRVGLSASNLEGELAMAHAALQKEAGHSRDDNEDDGSSTETLVFTGDFVHLSDPIPKERRAELAAFMKREVAKHLLLSVGGKRPAKRRELSKDLLDLWRESCSTGYGDSSLPDPDVDEVVASESVVHFPGLKLTSVIYSGTKLRTTTTTPFGAHNDALPSHEFVMVAEQQRVEGPAPMVWLYRKLTGSSKTSEQEMKLSKGRARSRVSIVETDDGNSLALSFATELQIRVDFPKFLVKALPTTKEKMEEQGSAAVLKTVSQDIRDAVAATRDAFLSQVGSVAAAASL